MPAPANPTAAPASATSIVLTWEAVAGASHYDIERNGVVIASDVTGLTWTDTSATLSAEHDYRVRAVFGATGFNPETDITWHSLFWAEGTAFTALGLADTDAVTTWPNETAEGDAVLGSVGGVYDTSRPGFNGRPVVEFVGLNDRLVATVSDLPQPFSLIMIGATAAGDSNSVNLFGGSILFQNSGTGSGAMRFRSGATAGTTVENGMNDAGLLNAAHLHIGVANSTTTRQWVNGDTATTPYDILDTNGLGTTLTIRGQTTTTYALCAVYDGDIELDPMYPEFLRWAQSHYGLPRFSSVGGADSFSKPGDGYIYHTFTTSGTLTPIGDPVEVEYLVVAGGGGSGSSSSRNSGGGGAGGLLQGGATLASAQTVTIGGGGAPNGNGTGSSLGAISAIGGGGGATDGSDTGNSGGSGGGGPGGAAAAAGGSATSGQGNDGGTTTGNNQAGSGGGAAGAGGAGNPGGDGGDGAEWPTGSGNYYAGGGGSGGGSFGGYVGTGGTGGGGNGASGTAGQTGSPNTGGGSGGGSGSQGGSTGGSGITIVRYPVDYAWAGISDLNTIPGLVGWWDADDAATITETGGSIDTWADKSASGWDVSSGTTKPTVGTNTLNGKNLITFSGAGSGDQLTYLGSTFDVGNFTLFVIYRETATANNNGVISFWGAGADWNAVDGLVLETASGANFSQIARNGQASLIGSGVTPWDIWAGWGQTVGHTHYRGSTGGTGSNSSSGAWAVASSGVTIGGRTNGTQGIVGDIAEIAVFNRVLPDAEKNLIGQYLAAKWGQTWTAI